MVRGARANIVYARLIFKNVIMQFFLLLLLLPLFFRLPIATLSSSGSLQWPSAPLAGGFLWVFVRGFICSAACWFLRFYC